LICIHFSLHRTSPWLLVIICKMSSCTNTMTAIYVRFTGLGPWFLCRYIFTTCGTTGTSMMNLILVSTLSQAISIIIGNLLISLATAMLEACLLCSWLRLTRTINVIDIFLESICYFCLLLFPFSAMMPVRLLMMSIIWWRLPSSMISAITLEVFLRLLSTNLSSTCPWLVGYTRRGFDMWSRNTRGSAGAMVKGSILLD